MKQRAESADPPAAGPAGFAVTLDRRDHEVRLFVAGELDLATQDRLVAAVADVLQPPVRALLLDLGGISFCGAAGVTSLLDIRRLAAETETHLVLTGVQPSVRRVLDIVGLTPLIPVAQRRPVVDPGSDNEAARPRKRWRRPARAA